MRQDEGGSKQWNQSLEYLKAYFEKCWAARQFYKDQENRLLYWSATMLLTIVFATVSAARIAGATGQDVVRQLSWPHIIFFHLLFLTMWLYHCYKRVSAELYERIAGAVEVRIVTLCQTGLPSPFVSTKRRYLGAEGKWTGTRGLNRFATCLLCVLYFGVALWPVFYLDLSEEGIRVGYKFLVGCLGFAAAFGTAHILYNKARIKVLLKAHEDWLEIPDPRPNAP